MIEHKPDSESIERQLEQERADLDTVASEVDANLDKVEASSPGRIDKIYNFLEKHWFPIMGAVFVSGGPIGIGENIYHGNWGRIVVELGLGAGGGEALKRIIKRSIKKHNSQSSK